MKAIIAAAAGALLLATPESWACTRDLDCGAGARCAKSAGASYGTCVRDPLNIHALGESATAAGAAPSSGQRCDFDSDCGSGKTCLKTSANTAGTCVKRQ